jgi:hypothetical protein
MLQVSKSETLAWLKNALFAVALVGASAACSQGGGDLDLLRELPVPEGATDVKKMQLGASSSNQQLFFRIERKYPARDVLDLLNDHFSREKWITCKPGQGWKDGWDSFVDESVKPAQRVHRIVSFWVRPDREAYAFVTGMYSSPASTSSAGPSNAEQRWIVLLQKGVNAVDEGKRLSFECS